MNKQKGFATFSSHERGFASILILVGILVMVAVAAGAYYFGKLPIKPINSPKACTQEAKQCPDGSFVSRTGPNCEFAPCPSVTPKPTDANPVPNGTGETANWKTYTNNEYKISFKYPADWNYSVTDDPAYILFKPQDFIVPLQTESQIPGISVSLMREDYDSAMQRLVVAYGSKNKENITFNGINFVHVWGAINEGPSQGLAGGGYIFNNNGKAIEVSYEVVNGRNYNQEAKQILSTFQFVP